jgi:transcription antitermination factor NusG
MSITGTSIAGMSIVGASISPTILPAGRVLPDRRVAPTIRSHKEDGGRMSASSVDVLGHQWCAVQVWTGREHNSAAYLRMHGYDVFLPCYRERRRWSDRLKVTERALFAGYLFCRLEHEATSAIVRAPGVIRIVGDGVQPLPVPADEIEAIRRIVESPCETEPWPMPRVGEQVRIEEGPLRGIQGVVLTAKNTHRLIVGISLLQRAVAVEIDAAWVLCPHPAA